MQIILVSDKLTTAKSYTLNGRHLLALAAGQLTIILLIAALFAFAALRFAPSIKVPLFENLLQSNGFYALRNAGESAQDSVGSLAIRLGQLQAELLRLDSFSERLTALVGLKTSAPAGTPTNNIPEAPAKPRISDARGGPLITPQAVSQDQISGALDELTRQLELRKDTLTALENLIMENRINNLLLPTSLPVATDWNSSGFGWRLDPFTGESAMHEGVDFVAPQGMPIQAAAAGIVIDASRVPAYGNMVEIDHGNGLTTRYAHASKILVRPGQVIRRGEVIANVGNTGRSTGSHLHFEVRINGVAQNPNRFLENARTNDLKKVARN